VEVLIACECSQTVCKEYGIAKAMAEQWGIYD
jgi:hypothetical protein